MSAGRQILKNAGALTVARGITAVLTLVTTIYLARVLAPSAFGILSWALAYWAYFKLLPDLGLGVLGQREIARDYGRIPGLVSHVLSLRILMALAALGAYLAILLVLDKSPLFKIVVAIQGLSLFGFALSLEWVYQGVERMGILAVRNTVVAVLTLVAVLVFVRSPDHVILAASATVFGLMGGNLWLLFTYRREYGPLRPRINVVEWQTMLLPALPIAAAHFLAAININMDQLMLGVMRSEQEVGWYAAAYRLLTAALIPSQILLQAFLPSLSAAMGDRPAMRKRAQAFATSLMTFGFPIAAGGIALAPDLIGFFGENYAPAVPAFQILMVTALLLYINMAFGNPLIAWDQQRLYMYALLIGAAANVVLNIILIPDFGIVGAATATLCSEVLVLLGVVIFHYRAVRQAYLRPFSKAVFSTALATGAMLYARAAFGLSLLPAGLVLGVVYAGAALLTGLVDRKRLFSLLRSRTH